MLKKILKIALIVLVVVFAAAQFFRPDFVNPPVDESETLWTSTDVPPDVRQILTRSCNDCHSNETQYPWYSYITPSNYFLASHIEEGRSELNFSKWATYRRDQQVHKLDELCEVVEAGEMPLPSYLWVHRDAVLSDAEGKRLCEWAKVESERLSK
jgi:hypothetical protein